MPGRYLSCLSHQISCFKPAAAKKLLWSRLCSACLNLGTACGGARVCKPGGQGYPSCTASSGYLPQRLSRVRLAVSAVAHCLT